MKLGNLRIGTRLAVGFGAVLLSHHVGRPVVHAAGAGTA